MFQDWPVRHTPEPRKTFDPPLPVTVDLGRAFARTPRSMRQGLALRVKAEGIALVGDAPGLLRVWIRTTAGDWIGLCDIELRTGNGHGTIHVQQWCPSNAITPAADHTGGQAAGGDRDRDAHA